MGINENDNLCKNQADIKLMFGPFRYKYWGIQFIHNESPRGVWEWWSCIWGTDIWLGNVPMIKLMILCNVLAWLILAILI